MNICIGGAAGDGIETMAGILKKILQRANFQVYSMRDFMSRIRGGHNFAQVRFSADPVTAHRNALDILIAYDERTYTEHQNRLLPDGLLLCDPSLGFPIPADADTDPGVGKGSRKQAAPLALCVSAC